MQDYKDSTRTRMLGSLDRFPMLIHSSNLPSVRKRLIHISRSLEVHCLHWLDAVRRFHDCRVCLAWQLNPSNITHRLQSPRNHRALRRMGRMISWEPAKEVPNQSGSCSPAVDFIADHERVGSWSEHEVHATRIDEIWKVNETNAVWFRLSSCTIHWRRAFVYNLDHYRWDGLVGPVGKHKGWWSLTCRDKGDLETSATTWSSSKCVSRFVTVRQWTDCRGRIIRRDCGAPAAEEMNQIQEDISHQKKVERILEAV